MQRGRETRDMRDPFDLFGGFGSSIFSSNPFDDPFFTRPFGSMFGPSDRLDEMPAMHAPSQPVIQELNSDDEWEEEDENKHSRSNKEPFVDHPDDESNDRNSRAVDFRIDGNKARGTQDQTFKFHSCKVTYGGVDGTYYSSSASRRMGSDGVLMEECKEADKSTGEAAHRISRGIGNKGHSVTRKLNPDGKVNTMQTLHNLKEDELTNFEEAWKGNTGNHLPGWAAAPDARGNTEYGSSGSDKMRNWGGLLLPSIGQRARGMGHSNEGGTSSSEGRTKKVVRINIE